MCLQGRCKAGCKIDDECTKGLRCQDGKCVPPCQGDLECTPGFACNKVSGRCEPKPGKKLGEACGGSLECATGYCLPTRKICSIRCSGSALCPSGYACGLEKLHKSNPSNFDGAEADCVPQKGKGTAGAGCAADADCLAEHCYNGFCMEACAGDGDCGSAGLQCVEVNILLDGGIPKYKGCLPRRGTGSFTLATGVPAGGIKGVDIPPNAASFVLLTEVAARSPASATRRTSRCTRTAPTPPARPTRSRSATSPTPSSPRCTCPTRRR
jgi:hypothetical protein